MPFHGFVKFSDKVFIASYKKQVTLPTTAAGFSEENYKVLEGLICKGVKLQYVESEFVEKSTGKDETIERKVNLNCEMLRFANDFLYAHFYIDHIENTTEGNTTFKDAASFSNRLTLDLAGLSKIPVSFQLYQTGIPNNATAFNAWDLTTQEAYTEFIEDETTTLLVTTKRANPGMTGWAKALVSLQPVKEVRVGRQIDLSILGIPASWSDDVNDTVLYTKNANVDINGRLPTSGSAPEEEINIELAVQFQQQIYTYYYFGLLDICERIGGFVGFILPIMFFFAPFFILFFLHRQARILCEKHAKCYREGLNDLFGKQIMQLERIKELANQ